MKREGHIYERMADWYNLVNAERISTKRKSSNLGVMRHAENRIRNLCEIQTMILENRMKTDEYMHEQKISGQDKMRDIAKLHFHPSHIEHQSLKMAIDRRLDKLLIRHTYASRIGYGQLACALQIKKNLSKYRDSVRWYAQGDITKYYQNISHDLIESSLRRCFKDEKLINAFLEPFQVFAPDGVGIPLGIVPSQAVGNLALSGFDHFMLEEVKAEDYVRYLDDFIFTGATKGEVKWKMKRATAYVENLGFKLHIPKIHRIQEGVDMMGFVMYGNKHDMWWRKADKVRWLKRRHGVTNPKRLQEIDYAAWGMLKWGNSNCKKLWKAKTGRSPQKKGKEMGVRFKNSGIKLSEQCDNNGVPYLNAQSISMQMLLNRNVEVLRWVKNIKTRQGDGRYALLVKYMGAEYKLIVNSVEIKRFLDDMERAGVTGFKTIFVDRGIHKYGIDEDCTEILSVNGRCVEEQNGEIVYTDNNEKVTLNL